MTRAIETARVFLSVTTTLFSSDVIMCLLARAVRFWWRRKTLARGIW